MATVLRDLEDGAARTVVLCCARDGRSRLGPVVESLAARGHQVEVVSDVDAQAPGLLATVQRRGATALYVLFESPSLPADRVRSLQTQIRMRGVPAEHVRIASATDEGVAPIQHSPRGFAPAPSSVASFPSTPFVDRSGSQPVAPPAPPASGSGIMDDYTALGSLKATWRRTIGRSPLVLAASLGLLVLVGIGTTAAFAMRSDPPDDATAEATITPEKTAANDVQAASDVAEDDVSAAAPLAEAAAASDSGSAEDEVIAMAIETDEAASAPDEATPAKKGATEPEPEPEPETEPETEASDETNDSDVVYRALSERKVRALDLLLVAPEPVVKWRRRTSVRKLSFEDATSYCADLDIGGVTGWRLATIGELSTLTAGRMLDRGKFWSVTKADTFGQSRVVWNSQTAKMGPAPVNWRGGRVLCVRPTVRPSDTTLVETAKARED